MKEPKTLKQSIECLQEFLRRTELELNDVYDGAIPSDTSKEIEFATIAVAKIKIHLQIKCEYK